MIRRFAHELCEWGMKEFLSLELHGAIKGD
jgi:hypothetical protein